MLLAFAALFGAAVAGVVGFLLWPRGATPHPVRRPAASLVLLGSLLCVGYAADTYTRPFLDDGPFHGRPVSQPASGVAQSFPVGDRYVVLSYDPGPDRPNPVVCVVRGADALRPAHACILVTVPDGSWVTSLYFRGAGRAAWNTVLDGDVEWTGGHERMQFLLGPRGGIREYWFSW